MQKLRGENFVSALHYTYARCRRPGRELRHLGVAVRGKGGVATVKLTQLAVLLPSNGRESPEVVNSVMIRRRPTCSHGVRPDPVP